MQIEKIGIRGTLFRFDGLVTYSYLIEGRKHLFLCDTYLGPESMVPVMDYISRIRGDRKLIVFNTHSDFDHVWGNSTFADCTIIAHKKCREFMIQGGQTQLECFADFKMGDIELTFPDMVFEREISFSDEGVTFFHTPGHTEDSASCYDSVDSILFTGDNLEDPIPNTGWLDLKQYIATLEEYREHPAGILLASHNGIVKRELIDKNQDYLRNIHSPSLKFKDPMTQDTHQSNLKTLLMAKYEEKGLEKCGAEIKN